VLVNSKYLDIFDTQKHKCFDPIHFFANLVVSIFKNNAKKVIIKNDSMTIYFSSPSYLVFYFLKMSTISQFDTLIDISVVDNISKSDFFSNKRFVINYHLLSINHSFRLQLSFFINDLEPFLSTHKIFRNAVWLEREVWDLFGVFFIDHPDLRRILTDYGFKGHPLRKDFPLTGYVELFYDDSLKSLVYKPVSLPQEYRDFKFSNPWIR
jgi:NADH:ubiquinone oxidoreductase subunit C